MSSRFPLASSCIASVLAVSTLAPAFAQTAAFQDYDVAAGPLGEVLNAIAAASGRSLTVLPGLTRGRTAGAVRGRFTAEQAIQRALAGTDLVLVAGPRGELSVASRPAAGRSAAAPGADAPTLAPVTVVAAAPQESYQPVAAASPKFTAELRDTPRTVSVVPRQVIEDTGSTSLQDVLRTTSGITFAAGEGGVPLADRPVIRGFNSTSNMLVDGMRDIGAQTREVFNLEQIEVFKGPDSAYYGRGGGGGSINMVSKQPRRENFAVGELTAASSSSGRATLDGNWALSPTAALRLNVLGDKGHVAGRDRTVDYNKFGFAPSLALGLGTPTRVTLNYYHLEDRGMPDYGIPIDPTTGAPSRQADRHAFYGLKDRDFRSTRTDIGTLAIEHDLGAGWTVRNMTRSGRSINSYLATAPNGASPLYAEVNLAGTLQGTVFRQAKSQWTRTDTQANQTDVSGEFRTGAVNHSIDAGLEFSRERWTVDGWTVSSSNASAAVQSGSEPQCAAYPSLFASYDCTSLSSPNPYDAWSGTVARNNNPTFYRTETKAAYVFDTMKLTEQWLVNAGLRWDSYRTRSANLTGPIAQQSDDFLNYQAGVIYKPARNASIYASVASASTPAALGTSDYDKVSASNRALEPERSVTYEIGTKWDVLDEKLSLTGAVFTTDRKNATVQVDATTSEQVGRSRVRGFERGAAGAIVPAWKVFAGYTYLDSEITRGAYNDSNVGKPLADTPRHSFSLWSTYRLGGGWSAGGGAYFVDKRYGTACDRDGFAPAYWRFDAQAEWKVNEKLSLRLNIQNLFDKLYYTKVHYFMGVPGPGRSAALTAVLRY
ncbi:TonB-dependent siderophore receptor [Xylophilus sp.]|uniref:TonB-dependent siderophore receptor n=1 Tax=Xylophilus sp. TaxID=2653893 RepID=UPI0013BA491C|nr:TonB-dependent siderophore receptor [Xylophilus sp.]KAF1050221.1 MAG: putative TonB-dependent receptor BfrD [Xylophilus sp.]